MKLEKCYVLKSGLISKDEKWSGNILVDGNITILKGITVKVEPGTIINFANKNSEAENEENQKVNFLFDEFDIEKERYSRKISINVYGSFFIFGEKNNRIKIGNCNWNGYIYAAKGSCCEFRHTIFQYCFGLILDGNSEIFKIYSCLFEQCFFGVVNFSKIIIKKSQFRFNYHAVVSYVQSIISDNIFYENIKNSIVLKSLLNSYIVSNHFFLNNNALVCIQSRKIFIKENILYFNYYAISVLNCYDLRIFKTIFLNNYIGFKSEGNSEKIFINECFYSNSVINIFDESSIEFHNNLSINSNVAIICCGRANIVLFDTEIFDNKVGLILFDNSTANLSNSKINSFNINVLLRSETSLFADNTQFDSKNFIYLCFNNSILDIINSEIKGQDFLYSNFFVEVFLKNNFINVHNFIRIFDFSNIFLGQCSIKIFNEGIISNGRNSISIDNTEIVIDRGALFDLKNDEIIKLNHATIKGCFCKTFYGCILEIQNSTILDKNNNIEIFHNVDINIKNSSIKSSFITNGIANIDINDSFIDSLSVSGLSNVKLKDCEIKGKAVNVSESGELFMSGVKAELEEGINIINSGKLKILSTKICSHWTGIRKEGNETIEYIDGIICGEKEGIVLSNGNGSILYGLKIKSKLEGIKLQGANGIKLEEIDIESEGLGLEIEGEISEKIEGIRIRSQKALNVSKNLLKLKKSLIEGESTIGAMGYLEVENSIFGKISVVGMGELDLRDSEIEGESVNVRESGEIFMSAVKAELEEGIDVTGGGKLNVIGSKIKSENTCIKKEGFEVIECEDTEIEGINGIVIEEGRYNKFRRVAVKSEESGLLIKDRSEVEMEGMEIESE
ncbi:MAG: hypothetical protein PHN29_06905, partial [Endomicrobiaceae bacterium]|nr:hypothetical protein [Endomicrobiaceae bacterium]